MVPTESNMGLPRNSRLRAARSRKKTLFWVVAVLPVLVVAAAVVPVLVCRKAPAETNRARDITKKSDEELESLRPKAERINQSVGIMIPDIGYLSSAQYEKTKGNICALIEETRAILGEARQGYKDIFNLNGVDEYIKYSEVKLALIHVDFQELKVVNDYLDHITNALAARDAGKPLDSQAITDATNATVAKMKELSSQVEELTAKAEKIKKDRVL